MEVQQANQAFYKMFPHCSNNDDIQLFLSDLEIY